MTGNGFMEYLVHILPWLRAGEAPRASVRPAPASAKTAAVSQRQELETLCAQLFAKTELVTSGKLQLIGLEKVRQRAGENWPRLQTVVHEATSRAMSFHLGSDDIFVRYNDDTYIVIFASASGKEADIRASLIAQDIRRRLFSTGEAGMKDVEVRRSLKETPAVAVAGKPVAEALDILGADDPEAPVSEPPAGVKKIEVLADYRIPADPVECVYVPLWDIRNRALTRYLCQPRYPLASAAGAESDTGVLKAAMEELEKMQRDGRKFLIVCPVHYETLCRPGSFEKYKLQCQALSNEQKKLLIFLVVDIDKNVNKPNAFWFMSQLHQCGNGIFAETSLDAKTDFNILRNAGFDAIGVSIGHKTAAEEEIFGRLGTFRKHAQNARIARTFALNISTLSLATSATCMGFDCLGGSAIHESVAAPDSMYRYQHEDLFAGLLQGSK